MITALLFILMMMVIIIPHEFGHFIIAKMCKVQVNEFSVGVGPRLFFFKRGETEYSLRLIPFGGFCAMEGEDDKTENPRAFNNKKPSEKIAVLIAGSTMNVVVAILCITIALMISGVPSKTIKTVVENSPAAEAGFQVGDEVVSVNDKKLEKWTDFTGTISSYNNDGKLEIGIERDGKARTIFVEPQYSETDERYVIGIVSESTRNPYVCMSYGLDRTLELNKAILQSFVMLVKGDVGVKDISGPVGMVKIVDDARSYGVETVLTIFGLISLNLAVFNMFPIPGLDGGRIFFVLLRMITGDSITDSVEGIIHMVGIFLLFGLMIVVTFNDVFKLF